MSAPFTAALRAERDKRAAILTAEGVKQSQILTAEGEKQSAILRAEGERESQILGAEGRSKAIDQYLQVLPQIAQGHSNKVWIIPSEFAQALGRLGTAIEPGDGHPGSPASGSDQER